MLLRSQCNLSWDDVHEKNGVTDLVLFISQVEILLEASNTCVSCKQMTLVTVHVATECFNYQCWYYPEGKLEIEAVLVVKKQKGHTKFERIKSIVITGMII